MKSSILVTSSLIILTVLIFTNWGCQINGLLQSILTGIISGVIANELHKHYQEEKRLTTIKKKLGAYEGQYQVFDWNTPSIPTDYKVHIRLDKKAAILHIDQTGTVADHQLNADIKIDELSFNYGKGNYIHRQKDKNPTGRIEIYLTEDHTINVDKNYIDSDFTVKTEKWKWKRSQVSDQTGK